MKRIIILAMAAGLAGLAGLAANAAAVNSRPRVIVTTDIGGTDFDDYQSMVHFLVYADRFDVEGIISSPFDMGGKTEIFKVLDCYERDYPNLKTYSGDYPMPDALRALTKQGATNLTDLRGYSTPTEGSEWIIQCAKRADPRPLWLQVWGDIDDLAQALHDDPTIKSKLRVYFIGGPNKKWNVPAYDYIARAHPDLWIIEANSTYRGWFVGGNQRGEWGNDEFVARHVVGHGALGDFFAGLSFGGQPRPTIKMGDTPAVVYPLGNNPENPVKNVSWGGQFVRAWARPRVSLDHAETKPPTAADTVETFGVVELIYHPASPAPANATALLVVDGQKFAGFADHAGVWHFLFSPKEAKAWEYKIESTAPALNGKTGAFTSYWPAPELARQPSAKYPNWWTDNPDPAVAEGVHDGAKSVSTHRVEFLSDFARRMERCKTPSTKKLAEVSR